MACKPTKTEPTVPMTHQQVSELRNVLSALFAEGHTRKPRTSHDSLVSIRGTKATEESQMAVSILTARSSLAMLSYSYDWRTGVTKTTVETATEKAMSRHTNARDSTPGNRCTNEDAVVSDFRHGMQAKGRIEKSTRPPAQTT